MSDHDGDGRGGRGAGLDFERLFEALAYESLIARLTAHPTGNAPRPGDLVDMLHLGTAVDARKQILLRENLRLQQVLDAHAEVTELRVLDVLALYQHLQAAPTPAQGFVLARRRLARLFARTLPAQLRADDPEHVRLGYHGLLSAGVMLVSTVDLVLTDVFPADCVYFIPEGALRQWSRLAKGRFQFSVECVPGAPVQRLVQGEAA